MAIDPTIFAEFLARLGECGNRSDRSGCVQHYARMFGVSVPHLRRLARENGFDFGYGRRADKGSARRPDLATAAQAVANLIVAGGGRMPTYVAIDRARLIGWIPADLDLPVHYVDRYIREHAIDREPTKQPRETRKIKWGEPGKVVQIDSTNCAQWFFVEPTGVIRYAAPGEVYRNKPAKHPPIMRYVATDPTSGCFRVRYFLTDGESADVTLEFFHWAMSRAEDPEAMPMCGVPEAVVLDGGPGNKSAAFRNACDALDIDHRPHLPGHSWAKGSVESHMHVWETFFESELAIWPCSSIGELNERAFSANCRFCSERPHSRHGMTRSAYYAEHVEPVRLPPPWEIFVEAATTRPQVRTVVGGLLVPYEGREYYVGALAGCGCGDKVQVAKAVLDWDEQTRPVRITFGEQTIIETALAKTAAGDYLDPRVYEQRRDPAIAERQAEPEIRLADAQATPTPDHAAAGRIRHTPPAVRPPVVRPVARMPAVSRTVALGTLADLLGRELTRFEVAGLGWTQQVTHEQITTAARALGDTPDADSMGQAAGA